MKDLRGLIDSIAEAGKAVLPLIVPGAAAAIAAGERMIEAIDHAKDILTGDVDTEKLDQTRDELEAAVNAHVGDTVAKLRGDD